MERENVGLEEKENPCWKPSLSRFHVSFPVVYLGNIISFSTANNQDIGLVDMEVSYISTGAGYLSLTVSSTNQPKSLHPPTQAFTLRKSCFLSPLLK